MKNLFYKFGFIALLCSLMVACGGGGGGGSDSDGGDGDSSIIPDDPITAISPEDNKEYYIVNTPFYNGYDYEEKTLIVNIQKTSSSKKYKINVLDAFVSSGYIMDFNQFELKKDGVYLFEDTSYAPYVGVETYPDTNEITLDFSDFDFLLEHDFDSRYYKVLLDFNYNYGGDSYKGSILVNIANTYNAIETGTITRAYHDTKLKNPDDDFFILDEKRYIEAKDSFSCIDSKQEDCSKLDSYEKKYSLIDVNSFKDFHTFTWEHVHIYPSKNPEDNFSATEIGVTPPYLGFENGTKKLVVDGIPMSGLYSIPYLATSKYYDETNNKYIYSTVASLYHYNVRDLTLYDEVPTDLSYVHKSVLTNNAKIAEIDTNDNINMDLNINSLVDTYCDSSCFDDNGDVFYQYVRIKIEDGAGSPVLYFDVNVKVLSETGNINDSVKILNTTINNTENTYMTDLNGYLYLALVSSESESIELDIDIFSKLNSPKQVTEIISISNKK